MKTTPFSPRALQLLSVKGFDAAFTELLNMPEIPTQKLAYLRLEDEYTSYFGRCRYSSFESYYKSRTRRLRAN